MDNKRKIKVPEPLNSGKLIMPVPETVETEIPIKTDFQHVMLNYGPCSAPGGRQTEIVIGNRKDDKWKLLDADSEFICIIPAPGIIPFNLARYNGPISFKAVLSEKDFDW